MFNPFNSNPDKWYSSSYNEFLEKYTYGDYPGSGSMITDKYSFLLVAGFAISFALGISYNYMIFAGHVTSNDIFGKYNHSIFALLCTLPCLFCMYLTRDSRLSRIRSEFKNKYRREILEEEKDLARFRKSLIGTEHSILRDYLKEYFPKFEQKDSHAFVERVNGHYLVIKVAASLKGIKGPIEFLDEWTLEDLDRFTCSNATEMRRLAENKPKKPLGIRVGGVIKN